MLRLLVMRHAKSDWDAGATDHARPLNDRGRRSAAAMGELLARIDEVPDVVLCSSAQRARETLDLAIQAGGWTSLVQHDNSLYEASIPGTIDVLRGAPTADRLMIVGHEPTWSSLVASFTGAHVAVKTATVVGLDLAIDRWADLPDEARAVDARIAFVLQARHFSE